MGQAPRALRIAIVVEDDADVRAFAAMLLEETEFRVLECASAEAAIGMLQVFGSDVAFMFVDLWLPGRLDGVDLAREIKARWPHVKVMVTSGDPGGRVAQLPDDVAYMQKPWRALDVLIAAEQARASTPRS